MKLKIDKLGAVLVPQNGDPLTDPEVREALITAARRSATDFNRLPDDGARFKYVRKRFEAADWVVTIWPITNDAGDRGYRLRPIKHCPGEKAHIAIAAISVDGPSLSDWWLASLTEGPQAK